MKNPFAVCLSILILSISIFAQSEKSLCPALRMIEPAALTDSGGTMTFSVNVEMEKVNSKLKYEWSVSAGTIVEGQGTSMIKIATPPEMDDSTVTAKVVIQNLPPDCSNTVSGNAVAKAIACGLMEDYGRASSPMEKAMLDGLFATLLGKPEYTVFFRLTGEKGETIKQIKNRAGRIIRYAKYRGFSKSRFIFAIDKSKTDYYLTTAYFVSQNKDFPECENCEIIKGKDVK